MAGTVSPQNQPELGWDDLYPEHPVNELLSNKAGSQSPFGDDVSFPLPVDSLFYAHPGPENLPNRPRRSDVAGH
ncbi:MAG: hypothetical protein M3Y42_20195 [Actinomycetota bacterium]|nr:hypothetical protein [Actinomycetota bacterium]MDQ2959266.1 hypothetical protein [Actinomycetota bacterium]